METPKEKEHSGGDAAALTAELVVRSRRKDAEAFAQLISRYERVALSIAFAVLGNGDAAGDVVQESFLRAWQRLDELKDPRCFGTWLCGIARNLAIDAKRRSKHVKFSFDACSAEPAMIADERLAPDPIDELSRREQQARVADALQELDELTRSAVILRYYDDLSSKEIAELLQISPAAVDMRLSRGRQALKSILNPVTTT